MVLFRPQITVCEVRPFYCDNIEQMSKPRGFISLLTTDDYLPGLLVLFYSLKNTGTTYRFLTLVTSTISTETINILDNHRIPYKKLGQDIRNPTDVNQKHRWFSTYSKLHVFDQTDFDKIVYLDADMLILRNIDELFKCKHMSATNAGGMLPRKSSWTHLNSGLFVAEPSHELFNDMKEKIGKIEKLESEGSLEKPKYGSEQDFLNAYYPDWPKKTELHLDHKYNMFHYYIDEYHKLFGYSIKDGPRPISVLHYASYLKPWDVDEKTKRELEESSDRVLEDQAVQLWINLYETYIKSSSSTFDKST